MLSLGVRFPLGLRDALCQLREGHIHARLQLLQSSVEVLDLARSRG